MDAPVRFLFSILILLALEASLHAEKQEPAPTERKLEDRLMKPDLSKEFNPSKHAVGSFRNYGTGGATVKDFKFDQKFKPTAYNTGEFTGAKEASIAQRNYATTAANTTGKFSIPNAQKAADTKTVPTKEAADANKVAATRELSDARRTFLGPESKNLNKLVDPTKGAGWKGNLEPLSIDDIRTLLNKNK